MPVHSSGIHPVVVLFHSLSVTAFAFPRCQLAALRAAKSEEAENQRNECGKLEAKVSRLERQKSELLSAFKKQAKLVDVLRRQRVHVEAARALAFTEEEFMKTLDWGA